jgi:hypothetical protein
MTHPINPWHHVHAATLADYQDQDAAEPFSEVLWLLNETEHGSGSPERLHGFAQLLAHPSRTPELDEEFLIPYLLRYLWEVPYALYTRQAWMSLEVLIDDAERLQAVAEAVLQHHPHGEVRAAVVQCRQDSRWPMYLSEPPMMQRLEHLMQHDAHPAVRMACIEFLAHHSDVGTPAHQRLQAVLMALLQDSCDEVRSAAFQALAYWEASDSEIHTALTQAITRADNARVLPQMLTAICSNWLGSAKLSGCAAVLDALAAQREHPLFKDLCSRLAWLLASGDDPDSPILTHWLARAPFGSGVALQEYLRSHTKADTDATLHAAALAVLHKYAHVPDLSVILDFLLHTPQTGASLALASQVYAFWNYIFTRAHTSVEKAQRNFEQLHAVSMAVGSIDELRRSERFRNILYSRALAYSLSPSLPQAAAQKLMDTIFLAIGQDHAMGASPFYPLAENLDANAPAASRDWSVLAQLIDTLPDRYLAQYAATALTRRFAQLGDESILRLIEAWLSPDVDLAFASEVVSELPQRNDPLLKAQHQARLIACLQQASKRKLTDDDPDAWLLARLNNWLKP